MMLERTLKSTQKVASLMQGAIWRLEAGRIRTGSCESGRLRCPITWAAQATGGGDFRLGSYIEAADTLGIGLLDAGLISRAADGLEGLETIRVALLKGMSS